MEYAWSGYWQEGSRPRQLVRNISPVSSNHFAAFTGGVKIYLAYVQRRHRPIFTFFQQCFARENGGLVL